MRSAFVGIIAALAGITYARVAQGATPAEIYTIFYQGETTNRTDVDAFFECLTGASSFGTTWGQEFGMHPITYRGSFILPSAPPQQLTLGGNMDGIMTKAFDDGVVPTPKQGVYSSYLVYFPPEKVAGGDTMGSTLCAPGPQAACAEHYPMARYKGITYDYALVPISCEACGPGLACATIGGQHEAAEALTDLAGAQFEVGDNCESQRQETSLTCCGKKYATQPLSKATNEFSCETITNTADGCFCGKVQAACKAPSDCCSGLTCAATATPDGGAPAQTCCNALGSACSSNADCCGSLQCAGGKCACANDGQACLGASDCCSGLSCDTRTHACTKPVADAGSGGSSGDDGTSGGEDGGRSHGGPGHAGDGGGSSGNGDAPTPTNAGCACRGAGADPSSGDVLAAIAALLAMAGRGRGRRTSRP
jgi:hypothetical protein